MPRPLSAASSGPRPRPPQTPVLLAILLLALIAPLFGPGRAQAQVTPLSADQPEFTRRQLAALVPDGMTLGDRDPALPAWPLLQGGETIGYIFRTGDLAAIPGFSGSPINMMVALGQDGSFIDVQVIDQNEPVFVDGLGPEPLIEFLKQYRGKSIRQNIKVGSIYGEADKIGGANVTLDGVTKATASVRIANVTILTAALKVARAKLGTAGPVNAARIRPDIVDHLSWPQLLDRGYLAQLHLTNRQVEAAFAGTWFAHDDDEARAHPDQPFIDLYAGLFDVPSVGASLLGDEAYQRLRARLGADDHFLIVMATGRYSFAGENFVRATVPDRLTLTQNGFPISLRDADLELTPPAGLVAATSPTAGAAAGPTAAAADPPAPEIYVFRIDQRAGFDPGQPWTLTLRVLRRHGIILPDIGNRDFPVTASLPAHLVERPAPAVDETGWAATWRARRGELAIVALLLTGLTAGLTFSRRLTAHPRRFAALRLGFLAVTLGFIGWYAQGQLSIVNLLGVVKAARKDFDLSFFLYDPMTVVLWAFVAVTLVLWGRGTFCGWLCPFGALQEFAATLGRWLRLPGLRIPPRWEHRLTRVKYAVLLVLIAGTALRPDLAETLAEAEPFKTAITLGFHRDWPFVAYAAGLLLAGLVIFKPFCRFLCPLGAALALGGLARRLNWIPRRAACGSPCKLCTHRCRYGAITTAGAVRYDECFQCLDCVAIYHDPQTCVPLVLARRPRRRPEPPHAA